MPVQIIDNFDLNSAKPIDNRFVVGSQSFYTNKEDIPWKYQGMRIWDLNEGPVGVPYVWTGTTYSSENLVSIGGSGTINYIAKFVDTTTVDDSIIYDNGLNVGIGNNSPSYTLDVTGSIRATQYLYGNGSNITTINATNITQGSLTLSRLQNSATPNYVITSGPGGVGQATWVNPSSLSVGSANQLATNRTIWGQNFNGSQNVTGNLTVGGSITNITGSIQFRNAASPIPGVLSISWLDISNINKNLYIPAFNGVSRTIALLEQPQTFTGANTFTSFQNFTNNIQVIGTSSFGNEVRVKVTKNLGGYLGNITTNPLNVEWGGIYAGATNSDSTPYINIQGVYTWAGDNDTAMYRSTAGNIAFKTDNYLQMVMGRTSSYTGVENYTTPGISMISVLDVWTISSFDAAAPGPTVKWFWLENSPFGVNTTAASLPYTLDVNGTSGPGAGFATAGLSASSYDRMIMISTTGRTLAYPYLESAPGTGVYWALNTIYRDSTYPLMIPAGRKWKLSMFRLPAPTEGTNDDSVRLIMYKFGLS